MLTLRRIFPGAEILAFEPNPFVWQELLSSCRWAGDATASNVAIGAEPGEQILHIPDVAGYFGSQGSTLHRDFTDARIIDFTAAYGIERIDYLRLLVSCDTIDALSVQPGLVKIDVEGAEEEVITGASSTLQTCRCPVLFESRGGGRGAAELLSDLGYQSFWMSERGAVRQCEPDSVPPNITNVLALWGDQ